MQSLDSSCQEADFIINDTLKKLKGSSTGINSNSTSATLAAINPSGSSSILRQQHQQLVYQQQQPIPQQSKQQQYTHYQHLQTPLQCSATPQQQQQLSTPPLQPVPLSSVTFSSKNSLLDSSLLHCNISQIPSQPPYCIFDDGTESPTEVPPVEILAPSGSGCGTNTIGNASGLDGIILLTEPSTSTAVSTHGTSSSAVPSPSSCSSSTNLSNFNSITSPSPVVPDLLLSTPPGINSASSVAGSSTNAGVHNTGYGAMGMTNTLLTSLAQSSHLSTATGTHQSNNNNIITTSNSNNNKKADKRPSASLSTLQQHSNHAHHHHQQYYQNPSSHHHPPQHLLNTSLSLGGVAAASPTSSPSKRQKITKDATSRSSPSTSSARTSVNKRDSNSTASSNSTTTTTTTVTSANGATSAASKFFNIHDKIRENYLQLLANDLNTFTESGLKQRSRAFILERLVESEKLNTVVVNLYPGNKGYSLALHYDDRQLLTPNGEFLNASDGTGGTLCVGGAESGQAVASSSSSTATYKIASSRSAGNSSSNSSKLGLISIPPDLKGNNEYESAAELKLRVGKSHEVSGRIDEITQQHEYALIEVLRWPYENDQLLQCIDREVIPDFLIDMLSASSLTLNAPQDDSEPARTYAKPNVFYAGCVIAQIRDFRQTFAISTNICDTKHVLLRPTNATIFADVQHLACTTNLNSNLTATAPANSAASSLALCMTEDKLQLESQLVLATAEPLCLDPDPNIGRFAINSQNARQLFNTHEMRRQMKKYTQISINRKRKLDQFTHHYGLELCDYLTRLRARPRISSSANATATTAPSSNPLVSAMLTSFSSKVPRRPRDVIRPIRPPRLEYPANLKVPEQLINVDKYTKTYERPRETTDCQPQLIEEYVLETEREDNEGRRVIYHIKLSIFQRPSNSEYLGELYVDRDYHEGERNGESCRFSLGTRIHANRYIQQFTEIFTEEGRKAVKITHLVPGHLPKVTHTGITPEQRQALLLQQRQSALLAAQQQQQQHVQHVSTTTATAQHAAVAAAVVVQQQQQQSQPQQQHVVLVGPNGQQQHILPATVQHIGTVAQQQQLAQNVGGVGGQQQSQHIAITPTGSNLAKNINIVGLTASNAVAVQQVLRQQQLHQQQQQITTQFIDANGTTMQLQTSGNNSGSGGIVHAPHQQQQQQQQSTQHIQLHPVGGSNTHTTTQLSLSNGSLVLVQQHSVAQSQHQQQQQQTQALQHGGITIQPANIQQQPQQQQQKTQVLTAAQLNAVTGANSALRTQLGSSVPILQAQLKAAPILTTQQQQQLLHKATQQQQSTASSNNSNSNSTTLHTNPAINAIFTNIMNSANQFQQQEQQQQQQHQQQQNSNNNHNSSANVSNSSNNVKNSSNASIRSLLNSAPAAMTSTPVASGTFTTSTGQHQTVTLVQHTSSTTQQQQTIVNADNFVQVTTQPTTVAAAATTVHQRILNTNRKFNIVTSGGNIVTASTGGATFRTAAGNLVAVNLNQAAQHQNQVDGQQQQQQTTGAQAQQTHQTVRVSMSALASQLASPPAIMTNPNAANFGYTVNTLGGGSGGSIKILNSGVQQQRVTLANALRRDSSNAGPPPNAIVVGVAAPSPGSDSNASNASSFAVPQHTSASNSVGAPSSLTLLGAATPSPSGSDHSQSSQTQNQALLDRLHNNSAATATAIPNMSPQQQAHAHNQYLTKTLVQSPAAATSIHSPMSSPHPQPSPSPQQQTTASTTTTTLNLQGINLLQGAIANFPGLQNVQVQIPGLAQPLSLQLPSNTLQAAVQQQQQPNTTTVSCVVSGGASGNSVTNGSSGSGVNQQPHLQQRSLLVSVPVSTHNQQQQQQSSQQQHTITLQAATATQQAQNHVQHVVPPTGAIVNLPTGATATTAGTQTVMLTNAAAAGAGGGGSVSNNGNATGSGGATTTMLTLPIAQFVGPGVQKLNPQTIRTSSGGGGVAGSSIVVQQQPPQQQQQMVQQQAHSSQQQATTINMSGGGGGGGGIVNSSQQAAIQLVGTIQQRPRNIQVVGAKQLSGTQRQLITTQRNIGGSTLKIATTPINVSNANAVTTTTNLTASPIVMSTHKLQLKAIKTSQQQQQHARILNQVTATAASQTQTTQNHTQQQQQQTVIIGQHVTTAQTSQSQQQQHIQVAGRTVTATGNANLNQQLISAIAAAKAAKQQQLQQQQQQQQAANRRRSATDVNK